MRALILNGSPRGPKSVTGKLLQSLTAGLSSGGAEVNEYAVCRMRISPCSACLSCMHRTPGICAIKDDMEEIYRRLKTADILILGTPVYVDGMSAQLKAVMDRSISCLQPFLVKDEAGRIRHPFFWRMPGKFVLVSTSGFPEPETFHPLITMFRAQAANFGSEPVGEICIPGSIALQMEPARLDGHLAMIEKIGAGLAKAGSIEEDLLKRANVPPVSIEEYMHLSAAYEAWCREKLNESEKT